MPSRKKAQGKARKEKKQAAKQSNTLHIDSGSQACRHYSLTRKDWSWDDIDAAKKLTEEYLSTYGKGGSKEDFDRVHNEFYEEYRQLSDDRKELFKEMMVMNGTAVVVAEAKKTDLSKASAVPTAARFIYMLLTIEVRDRYVGASWDLNIENEMYSSMTDIVACPREIVRFFHRRNSCDCLKELYYHLKETTKRTSLCWNCRRVFDIRQMSRCCHCQVAQYCSYECAVAHWPEHKEECKESRRCQETKKKEP
eukprot:scaffold12533_cov65-Cyclotella_meneghiniana.AAC.8